MRKFLFITPQTPSKMMTPLRAGLFQEFLKGLNGQTYQNWEALLIGNEERQDGKITYAKIGAESKEIKLIFAKEYMLKMRIKPDYIIRIDDDDVINPNLLERIHKLEFDCYADKFHTFYDIASGKVCQKKKNWLANTVVHKFEHAVAEIGPDKLPLINCDHGKEWLRYYSNRKLLFAPKTHPVYLRVLSPTTVTSGIHNSSQKDLHSKYERFKLNAIRLHNFGDINFSEYHNYLNGFGRWKHKDIHDFTSAQKNLTDFWESFSGQRRETTFLIRLIKKWTSFAH